MSPQVLHVTVVLKQSLRVLAEQSQVVVFSEVRVDGFSVSAWLCDLTGVYEPMNVGGNLLISFEVSQAVGQLKIERREWERERIEEEEGREVGRREGGRSGRAGRSGGGEGGREIY